MGINWLWGAQANTSTTPVPWSALAPAKGLEVSLISELTPSYVSPQNILGEAEEVMVLTLDK